MKLLLTLLTLVVVAMGGLLALHITEPCNSVWRDVSNCAIERLRGERGGETASSPEAETLNTEDLEAQVKQQLDNSAGVTSQSVNCPGEITADEGNTFNCVLTAPNGESVQVDVTLTDDRGEFTAEVPAKQVE